MNTCLASAAETRAAAAALGLGGGRFTGQVRIDAAAPVFRGHFPNHPILPGVMLLAFAREVVATALGRPVRLRRITRQRFMRPVWPDTVLGVACDIAAAPSADASLLRVSCRWTLPDGALAARAELVMETL
jgi:3-hydroxyacyl-[acyl-carrier-protein] dehydratase